MNMNEAPFRGGFIMGLWSSFSIWQDTIFMQIQLNNVLIEIGGRLALTLLLGFAGGFVGMFAKDTYRWAKRKILKKDLEE